MTQMMKVAGTNHLNMSRCLRQSPWQSPQTVSRRKSRKSVTWFVPQTFMICVRDNDFVADFVAKSA